MSLAVAFGCVASPATPPRARSAAVESRRSQPGDRDGDGVPDADDFCPDQAEDRDRCDDEDGCPDPDDDKDGTPDTRDRCRHQWGPASNGGCPLPPPPGKRVIVIESSDDHCMILPAIEFARGQTDLNRDARAQLDMMAQCLAEVPAVLVVEVQGHQSSREMAPDLARKRAEAVRRALVARGVAPRRMTVAAVPPRAEPGDDRLQRDVEFVVRRTLTCPH